MAHVSSSPMRTAEGGVHMTVPPIRSLIDWPAIIAGGVIAAGMAFLLTFFGSAIGLAVTSPFAHEGASATTIGTLAVLWFAFTQLYAFGVGGYVAGRLRALPVTPPIATKSSFVMA